MNEELKIGDRVMVLHMEDDHGVSPGTWGTVTRISSPFGIIQYNVNWDNGTKESPGDKIISRLALLSDADTWTTKGFRKKKTNESFVVKKKHLLESDPDLEREFEKNKRLIKNIDVFKFFDQKFFQKYLSVLRDSGITNMLSSQPYLYMGRNRIEHEFKYQDIPNEEAFQELLDMADESQAMMINGVMKVLKKENKEADLDIINSYLRKYSNKVLDNFMILF
jgi:hypothetical protein